MEFETIIKRKDDHGKENHLPHMEIDKGHKSGRDIIRVVVGHGKPHPNTVEHHIVWIELYGIKKDGQVIHLGRAMCAPVFSNPNVRFQVNHIEDFEVFHSVSYCNMHGLWASSLER